MILDSDECGTLIRATGEDGRVVLVFEDGHVVIVTEERGRIFTTQDGLVTTAVWQAGKTAGILKKCDRPGA